MDRTAWCAAVYEVTKSWTWLSDWTELRGVFDCHRLASGEVLLVFIAKRPVVLNILQGTGQPWQPRIIMPQMLIAVLLRNTGNSWPKFCTMPPFGRWWMTEILRWKLESMQDERKSLGIMSIPESRARQSRWYGVGPLGWGIGGSVSQWQIARRQVSLRGVGWQGPAVTYN